MINLRVGGSKCVLGWCMDPGALMDIYGCVGNLIVIAIELVEVLDIILGDIILREPLEYG